ncbi:methyltransferase, FxLD system [Sphaerimonospora cavernae]|uniref:Protein-L-isoaspartate O-methyltransferase n=1 Tax=Sphaerimonospora cavernae TaxID=1740611 RepID=A0ABV6U1B9_9ACTN
MTTSHMNTADADTAAELRAAMVGELRSTGAITSESVAEAVSTVPRHLFAPGEPLEAVYDDGNAVLVKRDPNGTATSYLSAAHIQAVMLEQAEIEPGMRVLEIGSGGYNAALLAELVGAGGKVTSVDIDPDIVARARDCLAAAGYDRVEVMLADAEYGVPVGAPYDRIVVTAGAWDISPAWVEQLSERGRLVVPLRMRGLTRSIAFDRDGESLASHSYRLCAFVPMQGSGAHRERTVLLGDEAALRLDDESRHFDVAAMRKALHSPRLERWSGAAFDLPDELELFLMSAPQAVMLHTSEEFVEQGLLARSAGRGVPALISDGGSFAYRTKRPDEATGGFESGVIAHGPEAEQVAARYVGLLRQWADNHRRRGAARIRYIPKAVGMAVPYQEFAVKRRGVVAIFWS